MPNVTHMLRKQEEWEHQCPLTRWRENQVPVLARTRLGSLIGYSPQVIKEWECGRMIPRWVVFGKLADVMGVSPDKLKTAWDTWIKDRPFERHRRGGEDLDG